MPDDWTRKIKLGRTDLVVSRLGLGSSYGVEAPAILRAFDRGINYLYWGTFRRDPFGDAIRQLGRTHRDEIVVVLQSYSRLGWYLKRSIRDALRRVELDYADVLLLGLYNRPPSRRVMDAAMQLKEAGLVRHIAISCHQRPTFQKHIRDERIDILQVRYNAAHPGAERDVFPYLPAENGPGVTTYTTTRWGQLCSPAHTPSDEPTPRASDCYRFALSNPHVHLCMCGPKNDEEMDEALETLSRGPMSPDELAWMRRVGAYVHANQSWFDGYR